MKLLFVFISAFLGLNIRNSPVTYLCFSLVYLLFISLRYGYKKGITALLIIGAFTGLSFLRFDFAFTSGKALVLESKENYVIIWSQGERFYLYQKGNTYEIGDILFVNGSKSSLQFVTIESQFDFASFLNKKGIFYELKATDITTVFSNPLKIKAYQQNLLEKFDENGKALAKAILFSGREDSDLYNSVSSLHLSRLLSTSGVYISLFIHALSSLFALKLKKKHADLLSIFVLSLYFITTLPKFSVIRTLFLFLFRYFNSYHFKRKFDGLTILSISALFFLLIDYYLAYQDSFILGFFIPILFLFIRTILKKKRKLTARIISVFILYLFLIPYEISYYHEISLFSLFYQLVLTPLFILDAFFLLFCFYQIPLYGAVNALAKGGGNLASWLGKINITFPVPELNSYGVILFYLVFFFFLYLKAIGYKPLLKVGLIFSSALSILYICPIQNALSEEVDFVNVGQGDCCLIRKGNDTIMIDTGGSIYQDIAVNSLIPFLKKKRITHLDYVITTHDDYDHSGALASLEEHFRVSHYVSSASAFPMTLSDIEFTNYNTFFTLESESNEQSLVIGFSLADLDFLIMGDAPASIEKKMMETYPYIPCDILKVGHHGSSTSTSEAFIQHLKPEVGIISVGKNYYGHPHASTLSTLAKNHVIIRRTDQEGTIVYQKSYL